MYEQFEHTADLGLRVRSDSLEGLFEDAARGLIAMIVECPAADGGSAVELRVDGERHDYLLFDWLNELLFLFDHEGRVSGGFSVSFDERGMTGRATTEPLDRARHRPIREVKAITYHHLRVERRADGWFAELIVDI